MAIVEALHAEWPALTYDVTIKIEHLLKHRRLLGNLRATGCLFVTSAVESLEDSVLEKLAKGHSVADFREALCLTRAEGLPLSPTFIPFTPWTTLEMYRRFLRELAAIDLISAVAAVQLAIRLLIPERSLLMELPEIREIVGSFDIAALCYPWQNADPRVDALQRAVEVRVHQDELRGASRDEIFSAVWDLAECGPLDWEGPRVSRSAIPYLTEPWYC
jgi:hypothetical protein